MFNDVITWVIQGPLTISDEEDITLKCVESIKSFYPGSKIILSTWEQPKFDTQGIKLIINKDPGQLDSKSKYMKNFLRANHSSLQGILSVDTKYVAKIRSDFWLESNSSVLENFINENEQSCLNKIITTSSNNRGWSIPFYVSDLFFFGETIKIKKIYSDIKIEKLSRLNENSVPLYRLPFVFSDNYRIQDYKFYVEQFLTINYFKNININLNYNNFLEFRFSDIVLSYSLISEHFLTISEKNFGLQSKKHRIIGRKDDLKIWEYANKTSRLGKLKFFYYLIFIYFKTFKRIFSFYRRGLIR